MNNAIGGQEVGLLNKGRTVQASGHFDDPIFEDLGGDDFFARGLVLVPRDPTCVQCFSDDDVPPQNLAEQIFVLQDLVQGVARDPIKRFISRCKNRERPT